MKGLLRGLYRYCAWQGGSIAVILLLTAIASIAAGAAGVPPAEAALDLEAEEETGDGYAGRFVDDVLGLASTVSIGAAAFGYEYRRWIPASLVSAAGILLAIAFVVYGLKRSWRAI